MSLDRVIRSSADCLFTGVDNISSMLLWVRYYVLDLGSNRSPYLFVEESFLVILIPTDSELIFLIFNLILDIQYFMDQIFVVIMPIKVSALWVAVCFY